jgi:hypothetical protein
MKSSSLTFAILVLLAAPASAQMVHLNCPNQGGQGAMLFSVDLGGSTVTIRFVDRAGLVTSSGREQWPATITDEVVYTEKTLGGGTRVGSSTEIWTINRYSLMVRFDCRGSGCMGSQFYGPCAQERTPERRRQF